MNFTCLEDISWLKEMVEPDNPYYYWYNPNSLYNMYFPSDSIAALIFCTFFWLNILLLIFTVLNMDKVYSWLKEQHKSLKDMYKASASVLAFINLAALGGDLTVMLPSYPFDKGTYLTIKLLLVILIIIIDLLVTCLSTLKHSQKKFHGIMHALALCQIVWFVHRLATDAIISAIVFVIAPAQTLSTVTLLLSTVVCAIFFVSSLLKKRCRCCSTEILSIFCTIFIAICTIGLIVTITVLFIGLVDNGLQSAGIGGFILSLVPSTAIFVIGLCINREIIVNFYSNVLASGRATGSTDRNINHAADVTPPNGNVKSQVNETTPLIQNILVDDDEEEH